MDNSQIGGVIEVILRSDFCYTIKPSNTKKDGCSLFYPLALYCEKWPKIAKNGHVLEGRKVRRSNVIPTKLFSVNSYDLKSMSFKFGNYIFITLEMPRSSYIITFRTINISLLLRPFASEVLVLAHIDVKSFIKSQRFSRNTFDFKTESVKVRKSQI